MKELTLPITAFGASVRLLEKRGYVEDFPPSEDAWHFTKYVPGGKINLDVLWDSRRFRTTRIHTRQLKRIGQ